MTPKTRDKIVALYWNWFRRGRNDGGLPYNLGDHVVIVKRHREWLSRGTATMSLEEFGEACGFPIGYAQTLNAALDEGITDDDGGGD
jgi:hypothetical protein